MLVILLTTALDISVVTKYKSGNSGGASAAGARSGRSDSRRTTSGITGLVSSVCIRREASGASRRYATTGRT